MSISNVVSRVVRGQIMSKTCVSWTVGCQSLIRQWGGRVVGGGGQGGLCFAASVYLTLRLADGCKA